MSYKLRLIMYDEIAKTDENASHCSVREPEVEPMFISSLPTSGVCLNGWWVR